MALFGETVTHQLWQTLTAHRALTAVTYTSMPEPVIDFEADTITAPPTVYPDIQMIVSQYQRREVDGVTIVQGDEKAFVLKTLLPPAPTTRDTLTRAGTVWAVVAVTESGLGGLWAFQLRRPGVP